MIIQCDQCQTKFKLPDEKLKPTGVKVRCSHCKHVFKVMPPEPPEEKAPQPQKEEAPAPPQPGPEPEPEPEPEERTTAGGEEPSSAERARETPAAEAEEESTETTGGMSEFDFGDFDETSGAEGFAAAGEEGSEESAELDFSSAFDEKESAFPSEEPGSKEASDFESDFGFEAGEAGEKEESGFDFGAEESAEKQEAGFGPGEESSGPNEFEFDDEDAAEDFGFGAESSGADFDLEEGGGADDEFDFGDAGIEPDSFDFGDEDPFAEEDSVAAGDDGKEFRFTELSSGAQDEPSQSASPPDSYAPPAMESGPYDSGTGGVEEDRPLAGGDEAAARPAAPPRRKTGEKSKKKKTATKSPVSRVLLLVFLLLVVLLGGVGYLYWQQGEVGLPVVDDLIARLAGGGEPAPAEGSIDIADQSGRYVTNRHVGTLLVIEGHAVNRYPRSRANIQVQAILYDDGERTLRKRSAYGGNSFTDQQLRNLPFAEIEESMKNAFGKALSNTDVPPGKRLPFTVVFKDLPENLDSFSVVVLGSQPASSQ